MELSLLNKQVINGQFSVFALLFSSLLFSSVIFAKTHEMPLLKDINFTGLKKNHGVVLIQLDVDGIAPSIEFSNRIIRKKLIDISMSQTFVIQLKNIDKGAYLIELPIGNYQITKINAPFYDLPFAINTEEQSAWGFQVYPNVINYVGELSIAKERSSNLIDVNFYHRIATHLPQLKQEFGHLFSEYPLKLSFSERDVFLQELASE